MLKAIKTFIVLAIFCTINVLNASTASWPDSPIDAYRKFLSYAPGQVKENVIHNQKITEFSKDPFNRKTGEEILKSLEVSANDSLFKSLSALPGSVLSCNKLGLHNMTCTGKIIFQRDIIPGSIGAGITGDRMPKELQFAYRSIFPLPLTAEVAGPMRYLEYLIEGSDNVYENLEDGKIVFCINSNPEITPIRVVLSGIKGSWTVEGVSKDDPRLQIEENDDLDITFK